MDDLSERNDINQSVVKSPSSVIDGVDIDTLSLDEIDDLPIGVIGLDKNGDILIYNRFEGDFAGRVPANVIGRNFFRDVAPCTHVPEFKGRFDMGVRSHHLSEHFLFNFDFNMKVPCQVSVELKAAKKEGVYWVLTHIVREYEAPESVSKDSEIIHIKDIATDICEQEPIHRPGFIQTWGALLVVEQKTGNVVGVSDNINSLLRLPEPIEMDAPISQYLSSEALSKLEAMQPAQPGIWHDVANFSTHFEGCGESVEVRATFQDDCWFLELMIGSVIPEEQAVGRELIVACAEIDKAPTVQGVCEAAVKIIQRFTGFPRVLMYAFDSDWNGQTIAEELVDPIMQSFKGLYFPEGDIPSQARRMYHYNHARYTPSRDYVAVPVKFSEQAGDCSRDLSTTQLRSVSPIHREYHRNIDVNGSMSLSIMVLGKLWGLVIGHSRKAHHLPAQQRMAVYMLQKSIENRIIQLESQKMTESQSHFSGIYTAIVEALSASDDLFEAILTTEGSSISELFDCSGAAIMLDGELRSVGDTASEPLIRLLMRHAHKHAEDDIYITRSLKEIDQDFEPFAKRASGALIVFPGGSEDLALVWFFPEVVEVLSWAGNPHEKRIDNTSAAQTMVLPRKSFERWSEVTAGRSAAMTNEMIALAENIRNAVSNFNSRRSSRLSRLAADLNSANARLLSILDNMAEGVLVLNADFAIMDCNDCFSRMVNIAKQDMRNITFLGMLDADHVSDLLTYVSRAQADSTHVETHVFQTTLRVQGQDSQGQDSQGQDSQGQDSMPVDISVGNWYTEDGDRLVLVVRDRSETETLQKLSDQRTKMEALGQFAGSITHDFNNFLSIISANLDLADMANTGNDKVSSRLVAAKHAVRRGSELTDRLLSIVRERPGMPELVDINQILEDNFDLFQSSVGSRITLRVTPAEEAALIRIEKGRIDNVILNLLNNARDAITDQGTIWITLSTYVENNSPFMSLTVKDDGVGMSEEICRKAMEPFFTTKKPGKGTGLGLVTLARLAEQMGGNVILKSKPKQGTEICLTLPRVIDEGKGRHDDADDLDPDLDDCIGRVLLLDDDAEVRRPIAELMRHKGYYVVEAATPESAFDSLAEDKSLEILLTDINLEHSMTGIDMARIAAVDFPDLKILLISGDKMQELIQSTELKDVPLLSKPFSLADFEDAVRATHPGNVAL